MLIRLTRACRWWAASVLVVLYVLCMFAPAAALAASGGQRSGSGHHGIKKPADAQVSIHVHADEASHAHKHVDEASHQHSNAATGEPGDQSSNCCGLMCTPALPASFAEAACDQPPSSAVALWSELSFIGSGPGLLYRPPIS